MPIFGKTKNRRSVGDFAPELLGPQLPGGWRRILQTPSVLTRAYYYNFVELISSAK